MSTKVRARFTVKRKEEFPAHVQGADEGEMGVGYKITLEPVCAPSLPATPDEQECARFFSYTPSGKIELEVVMPETAAQLVTGQDYYVDFTPVPAATEPAE